MPRVLIYGLLGLSLGVSGCQPTRMQSTPVQNQAGPMMNALPQGPSVMPPAVVPGGPVGPGRPTDVDLRDQDPGADITPLPLQPGPGTVATGDDTVIIRPRPTDIDRGDPRPMPLPDRQLIGNPGPREVVTSTRPDVPVREINPQPERVVNPRPLQTTPGRSSSVEPLETVSQRVVRNNILPPARPAEFAAIGGGGTPVQPASARARAATLPPQFPAREATCKESPVRVEKESKKVSFVFMVDTSASLVKAGKGTRAQGELTQIARGMPNFINRLPPGLDYRVGVVLAHGPQSPHFGRLFTVDANDRPVLSNHDLKGSRAMTGPQIIAALERKMMNVPDDKSAAQGEAINLGLYELTANRAKVKAAHEAGLFAAGRDVIVIAVTDEQDVCFDYASVPGLKPVFKPHPKTGKLGPDIHEAKFFNEVCRTFLRQNVANYMPVEDRNRIFSHENTIRALQSLRTSLGANVIVQAIAYLNEQPPVSYKEDDKEKAYGIIDLVRGMGTGTIADMANVDHSGNSTFANELIQLGDSAAFQMRYSSRFDCSSSIHPDAIDKNEITLEISDGGRPLRYSTLCKEGQPCQHGDGGLSWKVEGKGNERGLRVYPSNLDGFARDLTRAGMRNPKQVIRIKTLDGIDDKTGKKADGSRVQGPTSRGPIPRSALTPVVPASSPTPAKAEAAKPAPAAAKTDAKVPAAKPAPTKTDAKNPAHPDVKTPEGKATPTAGKGATTPGRASAAPKAPAAKVKDKDKTPANDSKLPDEVQSK